MNYGKRWRGLHEKARKAEQMGMVNEFAVYERKAVLAKAYLLNPDDFIREIFMQLREIREHILK